MGKQYKYMAEVSKALGGKFELLEMGNPRFPTLYMKRCQGVLRHPLKAREYYAMMLKPVIAG